MPWNICWQKKTNQTPCSTCAPNDWMSAGLLNWHRWFNQQVYNWLPVIGLREKKQVLFRAYGTCKKLYFVVLQIYRPEGTTTFYFKALNINDNQGFLFCKGINEGNNLLIEVVKSWMLKTLTCQPTTNLILSFSIHLCFRAFFFV